MERRGLRLIGVAGLALLAAAPSLAGEIHGTVPCGDRCGDYVVFLEGVSGSYSGAGEVVAFGQKDKIFIPHVVPLLKGSTLRIGNDDPFMHNVHARKGDETIFNINILFQYQTVDQVIAEAGVYRISCEPHSEMSAVIVALDNPFFTQPDEAGRFEIVGVPPGSYKLVSLDADRGRQKSRRARVGEGPVKLDF
jgi:plastocyanin